MEVIGCVRIRCHAISRISVIQSSFSMLFNVAYDHPSSTSAECLRLRSVSASWYQNYNDINFTILFLNFQVAEEKLYEHWRKNEPRLRQVSNLF